MKKRCLSSMFRLNFVRLVWLTGLLVSYPVLGEDLVPVEVAMPGQSMAVNEFRLSGSVTAVMRSDLSARVDGSVSRVLVDAGSRVQQGDLLLELDASLEQHEAQRLDANLAAAQANVDENQRLVDEALRLTRDNHLPQSELALRKAALATAKAELDAAQAELAAQQQRLQWHRIVAPFAGVVTRKLAETGEWVTRGMPVIELVATDDVYLEMQVPQERYGELDNNTEIEIYPDSNQQVALRGSVAAQVPVVDAASRTFLLRIKSDDPNAALLPGSSATALFRIRQGDATVFTVPRDALLRNPDGSFSLFAVVADGDQLLAERREVSLGRQLGSQVEITSGLKPGERVVVRGNEILRPKQAVKIVGES